MKQVIKSLSVVLGLVSMLVMPAMAEELQLYFVHNDHLGTPVVVTDGSQKVVWAAEKTPFGETTVLVQGVEQPMRFPGQYYDEETGLHYNYYRDYDPSLGRYVQSDPIGLLKDFSDPKLKMAINAGIPLVGSGSSQSLKLNHLYGYVEQNPVNNIDPFGLDVHCPGMRSVPAPDIGPSAYRCVPDSSVDPMEKVDRTGMSSAYAQGAGTQCSETCFNEKLLQCISSGIADDRIRGFAKTATLCVAYAGGTCTVECNDSASCPVN